MPIGRVSVVYPFSSKVTLFSSPGEKTEVVIEGKPARLNDISRSGGNVFTELIGRGGGNFETILPRDFILNKGDTVTLPGIVPYVIGVVETTISDPRDAFTKVLLTIPLNIFELKFVEVKL